MCAVLESKPSRHLVGRSTRELTRGTSQVSKRLTYVTVTVIPFILLITFSGIAFAFDTGDLAGIWYGHHIVSGDAPNDDPRWGYGTVVVNDSGNYTSTWTSPSQTNEVSSGTIQINTDGISSINNQSLTHGVINDAKDQLVFIDGTPQSNGNTLTILTKRSTGTSFGTSNLIGTWYGHHVVSGDAPNDDPRWGYGTVVVNNSGNYTSTWTSPSQTNEVSSGTIQINADGIFTINNQSLTHGVINDAKDQLVFIDGTPQSNGNALTILTKRSTGTSFGTSNLIGTWYGHHIVSGDAPNDDPRWGYGTVVVNDSGNYTATWTSPTQTNEVSSGTIQILPNGILSLDNQTLTIGAMNDSKDQFVLIDGTPQSGGSALMVFIRHIPLSMPAAYHLLIGGYAP